MSAAELALLAFTAVNSVRVLAYVPQIAAVLRDRNGATAISYTTWSMFALSHVSTVAYAILVVDDWRMAAVFGANTLCCVAILGLTAQKRGGFASTRRLVPSARAAKLALLGSIAVSGTFAVALRSRSLDGAGPARADTAYVSMSDSGPMPRPASFDRHTAPTSATFLHTSTQIVPSWPLSRAVAWPPAAADDVFAAGLDWVERFSSTDNIRRNKVHWLTALPLAAVQGEPGANSAETVQPRTTKTTSGMRTSVRPRLGARPVVRARVRPFARRR